METKTPTTKPVIDQLERLGCTGTRAKIGVRPADLLGDVLLWCPEYDPDVTSPSRVNAEQLADLLSHLPDYAPIDEGEGNCSVWDIVVSLESGSYTSTRRWVLDTIGLAESEDTP